MMKPILPLALLALVAACAVPPKNDVPAPPSPPVAPEHEWLAQLAGNWQVSGEADMGPELGKMEMRWTEKARTFGDYWLISEIDADFSGNRMQGLMTVGWDPAQGAFVGSWVDTTNTYLWHYRGKLDASRKKLTLESEGPSWEDPSVMALFRDTVEILGPGRKRNISEVRGPDGKWTIFMTAESKRH